MYGKLRFCGLVLTIISVGIGMFFSLDIAIFIFALALVLFGFNNMKIGNVLMAYTYLTFGIVFLIGSYAKVFY